MNGPPRDLHCNARFLDEPVTGLQRFGNEVLHEFDAMLEEGEIDRERWNILLHCPRVPKEAQSFAHLRMHVGGFFSSHLWEQAVLPFRARGPLLSFKHTAPLLAEQSALMVADALVWEQPENYTAPFRQLYRFLVPRAARRAKVLYTLSRDSAQRLSARLHIPEERFAVTGCGHEHALRWKSDRAVLRQHELQEGGYFLAVGTHATTKNLATAAEGLQGVGLQDLPLVVVGGLQSGVFQSKLPANSARLVGRVPDSQLRVLYENAIALVHPSLHEGFGLPPLEAMALGCPVIASNAASLPEVCEEAALWCDPKQALAFGRQAKQLVERPEMGKELAKAGREQARKHTWRQTARVLWQGIERAFGEESKDTAGTRAQAAGG